MKIIDRKSENNYLFELIVIFCNNGGGQGLKSKPYFYLI